MSYGIAIDRSPSTPNDPDLLAITINGVRQVVNFARRDYFATASLPDRLVVNGHHVHDGEVGVEWVTAHVNTYGPSTVNGEPTVRPVIQATSPSGGATINRRHPATDGAE